MTKKDFERVAAIIKEAKENQDRVIGEHFNKVSDQYSAELLQDGIHNVAMRFCESFKAENPRFDQDRFLKACGLEDLIGCI